MEAHELVIYGVLCFIANTFGGMAGGGAGFVVTPLAIFLGLSPAQAIASGKFGGLAVTLASLQRLRREKLHSRKTVVPIMILAAAVGLVAPFAIVRLNSELYRNALGGMLLLMVPFVLFKKLGHTSKQTSDLQKTAGWILLVITLFIQAVFSGGLGTLVSLVLMGMMGMSAMEANVTKRFSQVLLNSVIVIGVIGSGVIVWQVALVSTITAGAGGFIGARIAVKKGNEFVSYIFVIFMLLAGLELLLG
jgi:uncharacterized membrane protein YfcA